MTTSVDTDDIAEENADVVTGAWLDVYLRVGDHEEHHIGKVPQLDDEGHVRPVDLVMLLQASAHKILEVTRDQPTDL